MARRRRIRRSAGRRGAARRTPSGAQNSVPGMDMSPRDNCWRFRRKLQTSEKMNVTDGRRTQIAQNHCGMSMRSPGVFWRSGTLKGVPVALSAEESRVSQLSLGVSRKARAGSPNRVCFGNPSQTERIADGAPPKRHFANSSIVCDLGPGKLHSAFKCISSVSRDRVSVSVTLIGTFIRTIDIKTGSMLAIRPTLL